MVYHLDPSFIFIAISGIGRPTSIRTERHTLKSSTSSATPRLGLLRLPNLVRFGAGQRHALAGTISEMGSRVLICTDSRLAQDPTFNEVIGALQLHGLTVTVFSETEAELPVGGVLECVRRISGSEIDVVVGIGGGSCIDMAKVVALLLTHGGVPSDYYGELRVPGSTIPVVAMPTTAGTGSEVTPVAVLADPNRDMKVGISSPHLIPRAAICDPELTYSCPPSLTASAGVDALSHLIESFTATEWSGTKNPADERVFVGKSALTDSVALHGLSLIRDHLLTAFNEPDNEEARAGVMLAACLGGITLGTAGTAAAHALQYPLGAATHTPHGIGVGVLLPYVMRYNMDARLSEFSQIARIFGRQVAGASLESQAREGILAIDDLLSGVGIPRSLAEIGFPENALDWLVDQAMLSKRLINNNPKPLDRDALTQIASAAYLGDRSFLLGSSLVRPDESETAAH